MTIANFGFPINWPDYLSMTITLSVFYEVGVVLYFSKKHKGDKQKQKPSSLGAATFIQSGESQQLVTNVDVPGGEVTDRQALAQRLADCIENAAVDNVDKSLLLSNLKQTIQQYPVLKGTATQVDINVMLSLLLENNCGVQLSAQELEALWKS